MTVSSANFPERLRAARDRRGVSQADLAAKSGFEPSAISHFESGRRSPSFENLRRLADALNVSTDYLLGRDEHVGAAGPAAQKLYRNAEKLTERDLEQIADFAEMLARKNKPRDEA